MNSKEELELTILKHFVTYDESLHKAKSLDIKPTHFIFKEEMDKMCYARELFKLVLSYFEESGGSLLTYNVLSNKLKKAQIDEQHKSKFELLWQKIQDFDCDRNDLHDLLVQLKHNLALEYFKEMYKRGYDVMNSNGVEDAIELISGKIEQIRDELTLLEVERESVDMSDGTEYFEFEYEKRKNNLEQYRGIRFGLNDIDEKTFGILPGQIITFLAPSSGGKSVQLLNIGSYAHWHEKKNVLYFSFEMDAWLCYLRHVSLVTKVPFGLIKSVAVEDEQMRTIMDKIMEMKGGPYFKYEVSMEDPTPEFIEFKIREITNLKGKPDLVIIDYIGNMTTRTAARNAKPWERQGDAFEKLFAIAKKSRIPIITAQQINRETIRETRKLKESGKQAKYWQDASSGDQRIMHFSYYVIGLEPDKEQNIVTYHDIKMRDCGFESFSAQIDPSNNNIYELSTEKQEELRKIRNTAVETKEVKVTSTDTGETRVDWGTGTNILSPDDMEISAADDWAIEDNTGE